MIDFMLLITDFITIDFARRCFTLAYILRPVSHIALNSSHNTRLK